MADRMSFNSACELGFRGSLDEWQRLSSQWAVGNAALLSFWTLGDGLT
jgi:hypothetical protein